jgi:uncharacterized protein
MDICENPVKENSRGMLNIELTTTALCDMNCTYCFEGVKSNPKKLDDFETLTGRIREVLDTDWFKENYDFCALTFWGGEPTLNYNYIRKVFDAFSKDDRIEFHMYSNGYNIENMKKVVEYDNCPIDKFSIQISYDGRIINDLYRLNNAGKTTTDNVMQTFNYLANKGIKCYFKSTVPNGAENKLYDTWLNFYDLHQQYKDYKNVNISFSPTLDYSMSSGSNMGAEAALNSFRSEIIKIAKKEIEFFEENNRHLMSWFAGSNTKTNCSAGLNLSAIGVDGSVYACHGAMYSDKKDELQATNIYDSDFINKLKQFNDGFAPHINTVSEECKNCVATTCIVCPVSSYNLSTKDDFYDKWTDRGINGLCKFYQAFGEIDRSVQNYLHNRS